MLRQRERTRTGGGEEGTEIYHYAGGSDSPAWIDEGEGDWTRSIGALGGSLGALQSSSGDITLQIADMHGDVIATADDDPEATELLSTQQFDEYGNPKGESAPKFGWLGSKSRRTELPSGVIQMGVRSYVPAMGRFLSIDPIMGGSANAYEYAMGDPVNKFDLDGKVVGPVLRVLGGLAKKVFTKGSKAARRGKRLVRAAARRAGAGAAFVAAVSRLVQKAYKHWRSGGSVKLSVHPAHHGFVKGIGPPSYRPHVQLNLWRDGVKGSGQTFRLPFGRARGAPTNKGFAASLEAGPGTHNGLIIGRWRFPGD